MFARLWPGRLKWAPVALPGLKCNLCGHLFCASMFFLSHQYISGEFFSTRNHIYTILSTATHFLLYSPIFLFITYSCFPCFQKRACCARFLKIKHFFEFFFVCNGFGGGIFYFTKRSLKFVCLLNAVKGGCSKTSARYL